MEIVTAELENPVPSGDCTLQKMGSELVFTPPAVEGRRHRIASDERQHSAVFLALARLADAGTELMLDFVGEYGTGCVAPPTVSELHRQAGKMALAVSLWRLELPPDAFDRRILPLLTKAEQEASAATMQAARRWYGIDDSEAQHHAREEFLRALFDVELAACKLRCRKNGFVLVCPTVVSLAWSQLAASFYDSSLDYRDCPTCGRPIEVGHKREYCSESCRVKMATVRRNEAQRLIQLGKSDDEIATAVGVKQQLVARWRKATSADSER